jgi:hypothetical protein
MAPQNSHPCKPRFPDLQGNDTSVSRLMSPYQDSKHGIVGITELEHINDCTYTIYKANTTEWKIRHGTHKIFTVRRSRGYRCALVSFVVSHDQLHVL